MVFDGVITFFITVLDSVIDFLPSAPFNNLLEWLDWDEYSELISNIIYFVPVDCIVFFVNFCLPVIGICFIIGTFRVIWDVIPFT